MERLETYDQEIAEQMKNLYQSLSEKDQRRYAAIEAKKLGYGGISYICRLFGCDPSSVRRGLNELTTPLKPRDKQIRAAGGGRKRLIESVPDLDDTFLAIMTPHTAGSPMDERIKWSNLSREQIAAALASKGFAVSVTVVDQLLAKHDFGRRQAFKNEADKQVEQRDEQFKNIEQLVENARTKGNPVMSMDVKKKELIGKFFRNGKLYTQERIHVSDHDFRSAADGMAVPHGLYDITRNIGYLTIGTSHDTAEFACACIRRWWLTYGRVDYPDAQEILLLCDGGGSNNARHYLFKQELQTLADELGIAIRIAHYPPYTSKYNPIEHRLFPHVTRACQGVVFKTIEIVQAFMAKTATKRGLTVFTSILNQVFETKRKVADNFKQTMTICFDAFLPQWNYVAVPRSSKVDGFI